MKPRLYLLLLGLALLPLAPARAAFSPAIVAADARWVIYADLDALRGSVLGKELINEAQKAQFQHTGGTIAVDLQKVLATVGTVTAYGANLSADPKLVDGALVAQGTPDLRKIAESLLLQATISSPERVTELTDFPFPAYALMGGPNRGALETQLVIAFPPEPIVLVSKSKAQLIKAREVFRGAADSLAKASPGSPLTKLLGRAPKSFLFAASVVPPEAGQQDNAPRARILQMASSGSVAFGETGADTFLHAELNASSPAMAEKLRKILEGMTAMLSLTESTDKELTDFLNSTTVAKNGDVVTLDLAYPSARMVAMIHTLRQLQGLQEARATPRPPQMAVGKIVAEWPAEAVANPPDGPGPLVWRTIEKVELKNGSTITLGRQVNGGRNARFDQVEISSGTGGAPLVFHPEFMKAAGGRGYLAQFQFPGADGLYTLKVAYYNDPSGNAKYAVSVQDPPSRPAPVEAKSK